MSQLPEDEAEQPGLVEIDSHARLEIHTRAGSYHEGYDIAVGIAEQYFGRGALVRVIHRRASVEEQHNVAGVVQRFATDWVAMTVRPADKELG